MKKVRFAKIVKMSVQQVIFGAKYSSGEYPGFQAGSQQSPLKIEPEFEIVFVGTSETLQATLTLKNEDATKKVGVKLMINLPSNVVKVVKPQKFLIEPMQQVCKEALSLNVYTLNMFYKQRPV